MSNTRFTPDHIRVLAGWAQTLGLSSQQAALFSLYHDMTVTRTATHERVNATAMCAVKVIRDTEKDREMFYRTMNAWGIN